VINIEEKVVKERYTPEQLEVNWKKFNCSLELALNRSMYRNGHITKQMYEKVNNMILKDYK